MRLVVLAGLRGSGKTSCLLAASRYIDTPIDFIANNPESQEMMSPVCRRTDNFPFKSPCARVRQFRFRYDLMMEGSPELLVCEPPGTCEDESSPMINPVFVKDRGKVSFGPLITFFEPEKVLEGLTSKTVQGRRLRNMADESDAAVVAHSESLTDAQRVSIAETLRSVNPDIEVLFVSLDTGEGIQCLARLIESEGSYTRPLFN